MASATYVTYKYQLVIPHILFIEAMSKKRVKWRKEFKAVKRALFSIHCTW